MFDPANAALTRQLESLRRKLADIDAFEAQRRRRALLFPAVLVAAFAAFSVFTYAGVSHKFNDQAMRAALDRQRADLQPLVQKETLAAVEALLPVYRQHATTAFQQIAPQLGASAIDKIRKLPDDIAPIANKHAEKSVAHVFERLVPQIDKALGGLPKEQEQEIVHRAVAEITRDIQIRGELITKAQSERLEHILNSFDLPETASSGDLAENQRAFLHLLLLYADHQLMNGWEDTPPAHAEDKTTPTQVGLALPR